MSSTLGEKVREIVYQVAYRNRHIEPATDRILAIVESDARERERKAFVAGAQWGCIDANWNTATAVYDAARRYKP